MKNARSITLTTAGLLALCLGACSSDTTPLANGPLYAGDSEATICTPGFMPGSDLTNATDSLTNRGREPATVTDVSLVGAKNLELVAGYTMAAEGSLRGTIPRWPGVRLTKLTPVGEVASGSQRYLVLRIHSAMVATSGSFEGVRVTYTAYGRTWVATTPFAVEWKASCG